MTETKREESRRRKAECWVLLGPYPLPPTLLILPCTLQQRAFVPSGLWLSVSRWECWPKVGEKKQSELGCVFPWLFASTTGPCFCWATLSTELTVSRSSSLCCCPQYTARSLVNKGTIYRGVRQFGKSKRVCLCHLYPVWTMTNREGMVSSVKCCKRKTGIRT